METARQHWAVEPYQGRSKVSSADTLVVEISRPTECCTRPKGPISPTTFPPGNRLFHAPRPKGPIGSNYFAAGNRLFHAVRPKALTRRPDRVFRPASPVGVFSPTLSVTVWADTAISTGSSSLPYLWASSVLAEDDVGSGTPGVKTRLAINGPTGTQPLH